MEFTHVNFITMRSGRALIVSLSLKLSDWKIFFALLNNSAGPDWWVPGCCKGDENHRI